MPYRRLPNTDQARIRALKAVVLKGESSDVYNLAVTLKTLTDVRNFLVRFEAAQAFYAECYDNQIQAGRKLQANAKMARLYVSHFIQVLNLAVLRSEVRASHKNYYGLQPDDQSVPDLSSESALARWGKRIIDGENKRISAGGIPIYTPTIAKVKVHYDIFMESYGYQKSMQKATTRSLETLSAMRATADKLVLDCWNQIEKRFEDTRYDEQRMSLCRDYGVIYYYRPDEGQ
jgi:hypothetical protein